MTDTRAPCRLLDLVLDAQATGTSPLDDAATYDLVQEATTTALIQDALALDYTDGELLALLAAADAHQLMLARCPSDTAPDQPTQWLLVPATHAAQHATQQWTLTTWRDAHR